MAHIDAGEAFEIESKFEIPSLSDMRHLESCFNAASADLRRERYYRTVMRYCDAEDLALYTGGTVLRTMDASLPYFINPEIFVKTKGVVDASGILTREEYQAHMSTNALDMTVLKNPRPIALLEPAKGRSLTEHFNTVVERHHISRSFAIDGKTVTVDLALDEVWYVEKASGDILRHAYEMEVEFEEELSDAGVTQEEARKAVRQVGDALRSQVPGLRPIEESRADTGYRLVAEKKSWPELK